MTDPSPAMPPPRSQPLPRHTGHLRPRRTALLLLVLAAALDATPASAQRFGQWWWDGSLGLAQRGYENRVDDAETSSYEQRDLEVALGVHGYVLHPAVANFDLGAELALAQIENGRGLDSERLGLRASLELIPRGAYPTRISFRRERFDYVDLDEQDPFTLVAAPETSTAWGYRSRFRRGPLRGLLAGWNRSELEFVEPEIDPETEDRRFLQWDRRTGDFQHHLRLERRERKFGAVDLEIANTTLTIDERGPLGDAWRWDMSAVGIRRTLTVPGAPSGFDVEDYRVRNQASRPVREDDLLDVQYRIAAVRPEIGDDSLGHDFRLFYRWRPRSALEVAPFVQYFRQAFDSRSLSSPRLGLAVTWRGSVRALDVLATGQGSAGRTSTDQEDLPEGFDEEEVGLGASLTLGHGRVQRLRQELELELGRDDLRIDSAAVVDVPELGLPLAGALVRDSERVRLTLERRLDRSSLTVWTEWQHREIRSDVAERSFDSESLSGTVQLGGGRWAALANVGQLRTDRRGLDEQTVDFFGGSVSWRPYRPLEVYGSYRSDTRELILAPDVAGERWEAGARFALGHLSFQAAVFESTESLLDGPERTNGGFRFSITRRFAGWLPVVTAPERRGVIR